MPITVKTLYDAIPYDILADPELGPLPTAATRDEVDRRYALVVRRGITPERRLAWDTLRSPAKRVVWDIFCSAADRGQDALRRLVEAAPAIGREVTCPVGPDLLAELIDWEAAAGPAAPAQRAWRQINLSLSGLYDDPDSVFSPPDFAV